MKLRILRFRANTVYRFSMIVDKIFRWGCERHTKLYNEYKRELKNENMRKIKGNLK